MQKIPVYFFTGFLDSGKTSFIRSILTDPSFVEGERTLIILCEQGDVELDEHLLKASNCVVVTCNEQSKFNRTLLKKSMEKYNPERVIVEWNGMWKLSEVAPDTFPKTWEIYQTVMTVDATTFEMYFQNMGNFMYEMLQTADMIIFNRADRIDTPEMLRRRRVSMINRRADIFMDYPNGQSEVFKEEFNAKLDMTADIIDISSEDYTMWYFDIMEHSEKYDGHTVRYLAQVYRPKGMGKNNFAAGRFAMFCCADDISFLAVVCNHESASTLVDRDWYTVTAEVRHEFFPEYQGKGPVLYVKSLEKAEKPEDDLVY